MVSINTNLSSLIAQRSMSTSTDKLNQAIERLTTGYKINHASDNAANYSILTNMSTQLSSYDIAADNIAMGMDLLSTAQDTIAGMQERGSRLHALITQARNGTYGATSLTALTQEAQAIVSEINRLYSSTEYNGKKLLEIPLPDWAQEVKANARVNAGTIDGKSLEQCATEHNGFIAGVVCDTPQVTVTDPTQLATAISSNTKIGIGNAETLAKLAELVNAGTTCEGKTIILTEDVDLTAICAANTNASGNGGWNPIGNSASKQFKGTFNGNGHKVTGLYIKRESTNYQGLFGYATGELKNIGVEGANVTGKNYTGGLVGQTAGAITNSYATGNVTGNGQWTGGLVGNTNGAITNSYAMGSVTGNNMGCGGLVGIGYSNISNCYASVLVTGNGDRAGGLAGQTNGAVLNCYSTESVTGSGIRIGGLIGWAYSTITNSYATGSVTGQNATGGLAGDASQTITNSYATGNVTGYGDCGGLAGAANIITDSYAVGSVTGAQSGAAGGLVGSLYGAITNSYATGNVTGTKWTGGLVGWYKVITGTVTNTNIFAGGKVSGEGKIGNLIGGIINTTNGTSFSTITITNASARSECDMIGFEGKSDGTACESGQMESWLENITAMNLNTTLQVGINSNSDSQITVDTILNVNLSISDLTSDSAYSSITKFLNQLSQKSTEIGAAQNRLESALESTMVQMDNLTSSLSTIRDADIAQVSSQYIRQQILQQAAATLLSTANQTPSIALQLL